MNLKDRWLSVTVAKDWKSWSSWLTSNPDRVALNGVLSDCPVGSVSACDCKAWVGEKNARLVAYGPVWSADNIHRPQKTGRWCYQQLWVASWGFHPCSFSVRWWEHAISTSHKGEDGLPPALMDRSQVALESLATCMKPMDVELCALTTLPCLSAAWCLLCRGCLLFLHLWEVAGMCQLSAMNNTSYSAALSRELQAFSWINITFKQCFLEFAEYICRHLRVEMGYF